MEAYADNVITLKYMNDELGYALGDALRWPNPEYCKRVEAGRSTWNCPREIVLWQTRGKEIIVPFGMLKLLRDMGLKVVPSEHLKRPESFWKTEVDGLYDYQKNALEEALKARNGVLVAPCGSGKTQIGISIVGRLGMNTLWLTHTHELLKQSMDRAKQYLNVPMGTITEGKVDAVKGITFATVQTLSKIDLANYKDFWDVIIVDECHRCVGTPTQMTMFWQVLSSLSARYKFGLTATPKRSDGMEKAMFALLGPKFYEISREDVRSNTCPLTVLEPFPTGWEPDFDEVLKPDGTLDYVRMITSCVEDESRNRIIADAINLAASSGPTLVLSERVSHLEKLAEMCDYIYGNLSSSKKSERKGLLDSVRNGEIRVLFATFAIAKEGLDIPCLSHIVMASPVKDDIAVTQSVGRVMRAYPGKEYGTVWEFEDEMPMLQKWLRKRMSIYRRINDA